MSIASEDEYLKAIHMMYALLPSYHKQGLSGRKIDLSNTVALCNALESPQNNFPSIHIAGTNGKGTVAHILSSLYQSHGKRVGIYTSPHYFDFRERIKINSKYIPKKYVVDFFHSNKDLIDDIRPSFFELTVAMMFNYFSDENVDIAIIETGLGGRLDSTNIVNSDLSVITSIAFDHCDFLGDTIKKIAKEKAGIIKTKKPLVLGTLPSEAVDVCKERALELEADVFESSELVKVECIESNLKLARYSIEILGLGQFFVSSDLVGPYQHLNLKTALAAFVVERNRENKILDIERIVTALEKVKERTGYMGRWHLLSEKPTVLIDGAHNLDAFYSLMTGIKKINYKDLWLILGFSKDKDAREMLALIPESTNVIFTKADIPRAMSEKTIWLMAKETSFKSLFISTPVDALKYVKSKAKPKDLIIATGSIYMIGELF